MLRSITDIKNTNWTRFLTRIFPWWMLRKTKAKSEALDEISGITPKLGDTESQNGGESSSSLHQNPRPQTFHASGVSDEDETHRELEVDHKTTLEGLNDKQFDQTFEEMLADMNLTEETKLTLRVNDRNKKISMLFAYKCDRHSKFNKPSDYINYLSQPDIPTPKLIDLLKNLRISLTNYTLKWVEEFGESGIQKLVYILKNCNSREEKGKNVELECIKCLNVIINTSVDFKFKCNDALLAIARSLNISREYSMLEGVQVLSAICLKPKGFEMVLEAVTQAGKIINQERFLPFIQGLIKTNYDPLKITCMQLINNIVNSPDDLDFRFNLRNEFMGVGLCDIIDDLKQNPALVIEFQAFENADDEDQKEYFQKFDKVKVEYNDINDCFEFMNNFTMETGEAPLGEPFPSSQMPGTQISPLHPRLADGNIPPPPPIFDDASSTIQEYRLASPNVLIGLVLKFPTSPAIVNHDDTVNVVDTLKKVKNLSFLNGNPLKNISIIFGSALKHISSSSVQQIIRCDTNVSSSNVHDLLIQYLPSPDQLKRLSDLNVSYDVLMETKQFMVTVSDIRKILPKLKSFSFNQHCIEFLPDVIPERRSVYEIPSDYIAYLNQPDIPTSKLIDLLRLLRISLTNNSSNWIEEFGIYGIGKLVYTLNNCNSRGETCEIVELECIKCLKAIMNSTDGIKDIFKCEDVLPAIARALNISREYSMLEGVEILAATCFISGGFEMVLKAVTLAGETTNKDRFFLFIQGLNKTDFDPLKVACMQFINAIISSPDDLVFRLHLRIEFMQVGLCDLINDLRHNEDPAMLIQIQAFDNCADDDHEEFLRRFYNMKEETNEINDCFELVKASIVGTSAEPFLLSILKRLLFIKEDQLIRPAYYKLIEECVTQIVLHKDGCDPDPRATGLIEKSEILAKCDDLQKQRNEALAAKQEAEAKAAFLEEKLLQIEQTGDTMCYFRI